MKKRKNFFIYPTHFLHSDEPLSRNNCRIHHITRMSYSGSDMVLEERDFSVPSPVPVSAGICVPPGVTYTCTSSTSVVPESRVSQSGQSSAVSKAVSFRSGDLKDILVFKDSGMDSVSVESYQTGASDKFWEQGFSNLIEVNVPDMSYIH